MLKFKGGRLYLALLFIPLLLAAVFMVKGPPVSAGSAGWINNPSLTLSKVTDVAYNDIPKTFFGSGNIDCTLTSNGGCAMNTLYGQVYGSSLLVDGRWIPIADFGNHYNNFFAIPGSATAFTTTSANGFGSYLYYTYNLYGSLSPKYITQLGGTTISGIDNQLLDHYQINHNYDGKVADKSGNHLAADMNSLTYSGNSEWVMVTDPGIATLRINIANGEVLPFGNGFAYGIGLNPRPKNSITSDGRYAAIAAQDTSAFSIYDLSTCAAVPDTINKPVSCQSVDLMQSGFLQSKIPGFSGVQHMRFIDDDTISFYASYRADGITKYGLYTLGDNGAPTSRLQYLALGDSYISGEGAFDYTQGTDTSDNHCHNSLKSYPYLIGGQLGYDSYHSVACSGATTKDVLDLTAEYPGQIKNGLKRQELEKDGMLNNLVTNFQPGYIDQLDFVSTYKPKVITISVGGDDMGFSSIVKACVMGTGTCYDNYEDRQELVNMINDSVYPKLVQTYAQLKSAGSPDAKIYVIGYPQIAKPGGSCGLNVHLNSDEVLFSEELINYLDGATEQAADRAGVRYVDTQDALYGHRLCEGSPGEVAINGLTAGNDFPNLLGGPVGRESYHPNALGYQLLADRVISATNNLTYGMPVPDTSAGIDRINGGELLDAPKTGRQLYSAQLDGNITGDIAYRGAPLDIAIIGSQHALAAGVTFNAELHSTPANIGNFKTGAGGNLTAMVNIPADTPAGYHTIHFYGQDVAGQQIDIYKLIYVAATADDFDANGVEDSTQACVGVAASNTDYDQDGIDDACDPNITQPPAVQAAKNAQPETTTSPSRQASYISIVPSSSNAPSNLAPPEVLAQAEDMSDQPTGKVLGANTYANSSKNPGGHIMAKPTNYQWYIGASGIPLATAILYLKRRLFN